MEPSKCTQTQTLAGEHSQLESPKPDQQKHNRLANARILIIGGSSGLGYSAAEALLESNVAHITISSSNQDKIDSAASKLRDAYPSRFSNGITLDGIACDLSAQDKLEENIVHLLDFATQHGTSKLHHIIHSAGDAHLATPLANHTVDTIVASSTVRYISSIMLAKHAPAYMHPGPASSITLTTGSVSQQPISGWAVAAGVAAGLHGLVRGLALDLKPLRVNAVCPGFVDNEFWEGMRKGEKERLVDGVEQKALTGRVATGDDVAETYLYLCKDWNCTGQIVSTNSGLLLVG